MKFRWKKKKLPDFLNKLSDGNRSLVLLQRISNSKILSAVQFVNAVAESQKRKTIRDGYVCWLHLPKMSSLGKIRDRPAVLLLERKISR